MSSFAVLYRQHSHREEVVSQLAEAGIPFSMDAMDVLDTPEIRDLLACAGAVIDQADGASLFRAAALPQFSIQPLALHSVMRSASRETDLFRLLPDVPGGPTVLAKLNQVRAEIAQKKAKSTQALRIILQRFDLPAENLATRAFVEFVANWEKKKPPINETEELGELLEYLHLFREAEGRVPASAPTQRDAVQLMTAHTAKGLEFRHVFVIRAGQQFFPRSV